MSENPRPGEPGAPGEGSQDSSQSFGSASAAPGGYGPPPGGAPAGPPPSGGPGAPPPGTPSFGSASAAPPPAGPPQGTPSFGSASAAPPPAGPPPAGPGPAGPGGYVPGGPGGPSGPGGYGPGGPAGPGGPGGPGGYGGPPQPGWGHQPQRTGFFGTFFDFSFSRYVTLTFAKVLFIIAIVIAALWWLFLIISGFSMDSFTAMFNPYMYGSSGGTVIFGVLAILFGWIPPALFLIVVRVSLEYAVATIKTAQNTSVLAERE